MKRLLILAAAASAALLTSACVTVIDTSDEGVAWHSAGAQPFNAARSECRASTHHGQQSDAFRDCMAGKGWTRS